MLIILGCLTSYSRKNTIYCPSMTSKSILKTSIEENLTLMIEASLSPNISKFSDIILNLKIIILRT
jgi:hypothetical protein